jgi:hypothetical protein
MISGKHQALTVRLQALLVSRGALLANSVSRGTITSMVIRL